MAYNTSSTRFKSSDLAGLDCGSYLKIPRMDQDIEVTAVYTGDLEVGQCVAMIRVPAGARITGADVYWAGANSSVLALGDPFCCGRLSSALATVLPRGVYQTGTGNSSCLPWGQCGTLTKTGNIGDGCGLFYQYTCETDIVITNLLAANQATFGGWAGGTIAAAAGQVGGKWVGGQIVVKLSYLQQS